MNAGHPLLIAVLTLSQLATAVGAGAQWVRCTEEDGRTRIEVVHVSCGHADADEADPADQTALGSAPCSDEPLVMTCGPLSPGRFDRIAAGAIDLTAGVLPAGSIDVAVIDWCDSVRPVAFDRGAPPRSPVGTVVLRL